jgi:hypothetical protein
VLLLLFTLEVVMKRQKNVVFFYLYFIFFLLYLKKIYINYLCFLLCLNNIHKTCFHFLKVYTKHAKHVLNICTKCGYVQRELVCLLLPTSSVNNNNNTCDFIYISLSCDYLIWICHQNPSMHEMFISLSPSDNFDSASK